MEPCTVFGVSSVPFAKVNASAASQLGNQGHRVVSFVAKQLNIISLPALFTQLLELVRLMRDYK